MNLYRSTIFLLLFFSLVWLIMVDRANKAELQKISREIRELKDTVHMYMDPSYEERLRDAIRLIRNNEKNGG